MTRRAQRFRFMGLGLALGALAACSDPPAPAPETPSHVAAPRGGGTVFKGGRLFTRDGTLNDSATAWGSPPTSSAARTSAWALQ